MVESSLNILAEVFCEERPLILFAGQRFDVAGLNSDSILDALLDRLGCEDRQSGWNAALKNGMSKDDMKWLSDRFDRRVPTEAAIRGFNVAWSAVFTSSIDPRFARRFETRGRQPEQVLSRGTYARVSRSRSRPPIYYLLGKSDDVADAEAPKNRRELRRRLSRHSNDFLYRIPETATVRGLVVIAGYDPTIDLLPIDDLLTPLSDQTALKIIWFGYSETFQSDVVDEMVSRGSLIVTDRTLASAIGQLEFDGRINVTKSSAPDEPGIVSLPKEGALAITPALRLRVEASAAIMDDGWTENPEELSDDFARYEAFHRFHGGFGGFRALVEGILHDFAVERSFENRLWEQVERTLQNLRKSDHVIILHGQSGTGKSIAAARLAVKIRRERRLPVLVATNRIPTYIDIEAFCSEAERAGASATVLICDASQDPQRYQDIASELQSRGRQLLIVGTSYQQPRRYVEKSKQFINAPETISHEELSALEKLVSRFDCQPSLFRNNSSVDRHIFAMLYRKLPAGRERLTVGVAEEARATQRVLRERSRHVPRPTGFHTLAKQLVNAGLLNSSSSLFEDKDNDKNTASDQDSVERLIDYIMVAGRLDCPVPLNLVFRIIAPDDDIGLDQIIHLFADLDLFRWSEVGVEGSDLIISPRIQLEADLLCRQRLPNPEDEITCLTELIGNVRLGIDQKAERFFLLDLLQKLDREGPRGNMYKDGYLKFANELQKLREKHGFVDAALMLRESVFRRQAVLSSSPGTGIENQSEERNLHILDAARATVEKALELINSGEIFANKRTRQLLTSEHSAIYGFLAIQQMKAGDSEGFWSDYLAARVASTKAAALSEEDYHPVDIALWTARDVLRQGTGLSEEQRAEILADLHATLDLAEGLEFGGSQQIRYLERRKSVADVMDNSPLGDEALARLENVAPAVATFLIARQKAEIVDTEEPPFNEGTRQVAMETADYISKRANSWTAEDVRCQRLLLRLRWAQATGQHLLREQRGRTPTDRNLTAELLSIVSALNEQAGTEARNQERFLEAVLSWLLKDTTRAIDIWKALSNDTQYEDRSRTVRRLLVTDESGSPCLFRGRVEGGKGTDKWRVRVEGIDKPIALQANEYEGEDITHGRELPQFRIAFNYIGPIADPSPH